MPNQLQSRMKVTIEGLLFKGSKNTPIFIYGDINENSISSEYATTDYYNWLDSIPTSISSDINIFTSDYNLSSPSFSFVAIEDACKLFLRTSSPDYIGFLNTDITKNDVTYSSGYWQTQIEIDYFGTIEAGDVLYIQDETMYVDSVDSTSGTVYTLTVSRKMAINDFGVTTDPTLTPDLYSFFKAYSAGTEVYINFVPYWTFRRVRMLINNSPFEITENPLNAGYYSYVGIIDNISTDDHQTLINITSRDSIAPLIDIKLPTTRDLFKATFNSDVSIGSDRFYLAGIIEASENDNFDNHQFAVYKSHMVRDNNNTIGVDTVYFRKGVAWRSWKVGDAVYYTTGSYTDTSYVESDLISGNGGLSGSYDNGPMYFYSQGEYPVFPKTLSRDDVNEIIDNDSLIYETLSFGRDTPDELVPFQIYDTDGTFLGRNPIAIVLALLTSTGDTTYPSIFNVLNSNWSAGLTNINLFDWKATLNKYKNFKIDNLNLGFEGQFSLKEVVISLLRTVDCFLYIDNSNLLQIGETFENAIDYVYQTEGYVFDVVPIDPIVIESSICKITNTQKPTNIVAKVGGIPGEESFNVNVVNITGDRRDGVLNTTNYNLDYSYFDREKALRSTNGFSNLEIKIRNYKEELYNSKPILECEVNLSAYSSIIPYDEDKPFDWYSSPHLTLGNWVVVRGNNEIIGPDGIKTIINNYENYVIFFGRIIGFDYDVARNVCIYKIYLKYWDTGTLPKHVSPAARITSYNDADKEITVQANSIYSNILTDSSLPDYATAAGLGNNTDFAIGDQVRIVDEYGRDSYLLYQSSGYTKITDIVDNVITIQNNLNSNIPSDMAYYLRLADYDEYQNLTFDKSIIEYISNLVDTAGQLSSFQYDLSILPVSQRRFWAFLANNFSKLGANNDNGDPWSS